jgi:hypothetical protein
MTVERRDEPVIFVVGADGAHLIDGTHRLRRRIQDGCTEARAFLMAPTILKAMRVRLLHQQKGGGWKQEGGISDEALDREILAATEMAKHVVRPRN